MPEGKRRPGRPASPQRPQSAGEQVRARELLDRHFGLQMQDLRLVQGLTAAWTAAAIGIEPEIYRCYETGELAVPAWVLYDLARLFGRDPGFFFEGLALAGDPALLRAERELLPESAGEETATETAARREREIIEYFRELSPEAQKTIHTVLRSMRLTRPGLKAAAARMATPLPGEPRPESGTEPDSQSHPESRPQPHSRPHSQARKGITSQPGAHTRPKSRSDSRPETGPDLRDTKG